MTRWALLLLCLITAPLQAHDARPVYVHMKEAASGQVQVQWNTPVTIARSALPHPVLPSMCTARGEQVVQQSNGAFVARRNYHCPQGLAGYSIGIQFPTINPSLSTYFYIERADGEGHTHILKPGQVSWILPAEPSGLAVARQYTGLGIVHILSGLDHLLFVACLLLLVRRPRQLLLTITGFTLGHSLTLALSILNIVQLPVAPVEAVIALSVVFLASEITKEESSSLSWRHPAAVSVTFGLLHGFGFATVLGEIGLPSAERLTALLFFNLGVEIGQILFVLALLASYRVLRVLSARRSVWSYSDLRAPPVNTLLCYVIGGVASFWAIERVAGFWV